MKKMALMVFFLCVLIRLSTGAPPSCPAHCSCDLTRTSIKISCEPEAMVTEELVGVLEVYRNSSDVTTISVTGTSLYDMPNVVCSFNALQVLNFSQNHFTWLPATCFNKWPRLISADVSGNEIVTLPDGILENKPCLKQVDFSGNYIHGIGLQVFSNASNFPELELIDLSSNLLSAVDSWPMVLVEHHHITINLSSNQIREFSNYVNFTFNRLASYNGVISLERNFIEGFACLAPWFSPDDLACIFAHTSNLSLQLQLNPYYCDCSDYFWMRIFLTKDLNRTILNQIECVGVRGEPLTKLMALSLLEIICDSCDNWTIPYSEVCHCTERPENRTYHISCQGLRVDDLPATLPQPFLHNISYTFHMKISSRRIDALNPQSYFNSVSYLNLSNVDLVSVDAFAIEQLRTAEVLLNDNRLQNFPKNIRNVNFSGKLYLQGNPWNCSCEQQWFQIWLHKLDNNKHLGSRELLCDRPEGLKGKNALQIDFCSNDFRLSWEVIAGISAAVITAIVIGLMAVGCRVRYQRHNSYMVDEWDDHPDSTYDAFISFAWEDYNAADSIVTLLEEGHGFRCCVHHRDFHPGGRFMDQMGDAIDNSRRTLCLLSPHFVNSEYCIWEFNYACNADVRRGKKRLAAIMLAPIMEFRGSSRVVQRYISHINYIDRGDDSFHEKLLYVMQNGTNEGGTVSSGDRNEELAEESALLPS